MEITGVVAVVEVVDVVGVVEVVVEVVDVEDVGFVGVVDIIASNNHSRTSILLFYRLFSLNRLHGHGPEPPFSTPGWLSCVDVP